MRSQYHARRAPVQDMLCKYLFRWISTERDQPKQGRKARRIGGQRRCLPKAARRAGKARRNREPMDKPARQGRPAGVSAANQITDRNRGHPVQDVIDELNLYVRGWLNYCKLSSTYAEMKDLSEWVRRRVRLFCRMPWKQPRTRRRHLLARGGVPERVPMASRSRKGYWRMGRN